MMVLPRATQTGVFATKTSAVPDVLRTIDNVSRTVLGPLTEMTWTQPTSCTVPYAQVDCPTCAFMWLGQKCASTRNTDDQACWPPTTEGVSKTTEGLNGWGIHSPGLSCPNGYTKAAESKYGENDYGFQFPITAGETALGCCPSVQAGEPTYFITSAYKDYQTCLRIATSGPVERGVCTNGVLAVSTNTLPYIITASSSAKTMSTYAIYAPMFQVVHHSSDLPGYVAPISNDIVNNHLSPTSNVKQTNDDASSRLSTGAQAGIIIASTLIGILLAVGAFLLWRRHQQRKQFMPLSQPTEHFGAADQNSAWGHSDKESYNGSTATVAPVPWPQQSPSPQYAELRGDSGGSELHPHSVVSPQSPLELGAGRFHDNSNLPYDGNDKSRIVTYGRIGY